MHNCKLRLLPKQLIALLLLVGISYAVHGNPPADTSRIISQQCQQRILATYHTAVNQLLPMQALPFDVAANDYSFAAIEKVRKQIFKANLQQVRSYLLQATASKTVYASQDTWVAVKSVWIDYLLSVDSFATGYKEASILLAFVDSATCHNEELAYVAMARAAFQMDDYVNANNNVEKALSVAKQKKDKTIEARAYLMAGTLARRYFYGSTHRSLPYYDKAISAASECGDTVTMIRATFLKHADITELGDYDGGVAFLEQAVALTIGSGYLKFAPNVCEHLSLDLNAIGKPSESTFMLEAALGYTRQFGMAILETHMYVQISSLYSTRKMYDSAIYYLDQCKNEGLLAPGIKTPLLQKADVYYQMGNYKQAATLYDSGMNDYLNTFILQGQNSISRWETGLRMHDKELLLQKNISAQKQLTWIIIAICTVLLIMILSFIRQRSLQKRLISQNRTITHQSEKLQKSLADKELLLKEIHHRVKNNLQVIESLLDMHQDKIESPEQQQAFTQARTHIHSIAIIHQNLYQQESLSTVNMHSFADDLFTQTESIFNPNKKSIVFNNTIQHVQLDIDTAIPLGLILNELLTNAFKYVLPKVDVMELTVGIAQGSHPEQYILDYRDNGKGLPGGFDTKKAGSIGMELIKQLSRQIGGRMKYTYENGSHFTLSFLTLKGRKEMD